MSQMSGGWPQPRPFWKMAVIWFAVATFVIGFGVVSFLMMPKSESSGWAHARPVPQHGNAAPPQPALTCPPCVCQCGPLKAEEDGR